MPEKDGEVYINIGGCAHYGVAIDYKTKKINKNMSEKEFMQKIIYLAQKYSDGQIKLSRLKDVIKNRNWSKPDPSSKFYFFYYEKYVTFEVFETIDKGYQTIGFSSYS